MTENAPLTAGGNADVRNGRKLTADEKKLRAHHHWFAVASPTTGGGAASGGRITGCGQPSPDGVKNFLIKEMGATCVVTLQQSSEGIPNVASVAAVARQKKGRNPMKVHYSHIKKKEKKDHSDNNQKEGVEQVAAEETNATAVDGDEHELTSLHLAVPSNDDAEEGKIELIGKECAQNRILWLHLPLSGANLGSNRSGEEAQDLESLQRLSHVADLIVKEGHSVVLHCAAGMHRTGASIYIILRLVGYTPEAALSAVKEIRGVTYEELIKFRKRIGMPLLEKAEGLFQQLFSDTPSATSSEIHERSNDPTTN